ncbi:Sensor histidine kinase RcsC (plasmid) [Pseudoseohaeicola sp. NH-UV-7]|uniref:response regulator n=1 Tax=Sulfitobacter sp. TBRI5 TaxID=2989732 RepID=UPI003A6458A6
MSLANKLAEERRARLAAERLLELKQAELFAANRKLGNHARALSDEIVETRAEVATVRDENVRVKSDLTVAHQKVEIAERRLWHSIETIEDGFAVFDVDSNLVAANAAYLSVFDGLEDVRPGVNYVHILQLLTEEGIVNTGGLSAIDWRAMMTDRWHAPTPEPIVVELWNRLFIRLVDKRGQGGDVVSLGLNITASVRYEQELKEARRNAEAANRTKSAFLANMSHEIRTPMNGVVGMAELLTDTELSAEQQLYVTTIKNSGEALLVIINDVLDYSKIEAEKLVLHPAPFNLERCIHEVVVLLQPSAREKGIELLVDYDLFLPTEFVGDAGRLRQVLTNLIGNGVKFTTQGHVLIRATGVPASDGEKTRIHIAIEDTGIGIPDDKVGHIFGEFNQVEDDRNRQFEGTGLGLAISQRLVEMMGGQVWVESEVGMGSCFGFSLLMAATDATPAEPPRLPESLRNVLVVSEVESNALILEKQMRQLGVDATCFASGATALASMNDSVDLVLSDHNMADMDGMELATALRQAGWSVPVILLSANPGFAEQDPARRHVHAVVQKPVRRNDLLTQLATLAQDIASAEKTVPQKDRQETAPPDIPRLMRVLAAEDNKTNQLVFRKMIKDLEIELQFAANGLEAVDLFQSFAPDMIFMDISMPKMDGKEATQEIRKLEKTGGGHVPIVALTAHAMDGDEQGILSAGLDHYLTKPLRKAAIHDKIREFHPPEARPLVAEADQAAE